MQSAIIEGLMNNPYFSAGFGLVGVGTGLALLRNAYRAALTLAKRNFLITLEVPSKDKSYNWVLNWISTQTENRQHSSVQTLFKKHENGSVTTDFDFVPSLGNHFFQYKGHWIRVQRHRETQMVDLHTGNPWETVTLTAWGRNRQLFVDLLAEAKQMALTREEGKTVIYTSWGTEWRPFGSPRRRRPISSVILDQGVAERILKDLQNFMQSSKWYTDRGIPYRRGYLLYGPPGCGKTSFIQALAGEVGYDICILSLSDRSLTDDRFNYILSVAPQRCFILLEDVDAAFHKRESTSKDGYNIALTFSGLLNALDGVASSEERIIFMTTNHIEKLDPALIRPGRVDVKEMIGYATTSQMRQMFLRFFPEEPALADKFVQRVTEAATATEPPTPISMAQLQGYFMFHKTDAQEAVDNAHTVLTIR